jgi:hypothetical protein
VTSFTTVANTVARKVLSFTAVAKTVAKKTIGLAHMHVAPSGDSCDFVRTMLASLNHSYGSVHAGMGHLNSTRGGVQHARQLHTALPCSLNTTRTGISAALGKRNGAPAIT